MKMRLGIRSLAAIGVATLINGSVFAMELPLSDVYGSTEGCAGYAMGDLVGTDSPVPFLIVSAEAAYRYGTACTFYHGQSIGESSWLIQTSCNSEGEVFPDSLTLIEDKATGTLALYSLHYKSAAVIDACSLPPAIRAEREWRRQASKKQ